MLRDLAEHKPQQQLQTRLFLPLSLHPAVRLRSNWLLWWLRRRALKSIAACCLEVTAESDRHHLSVLDCTALDPALLTSQWLQFFIAGPYSK